MRCGCDPDALPGLQRAHRDHSRRGRRGQRADRPRRTRSGTRAWAKTRALAPGRLFNPLVMRFTKKATRDDITEVIGAHANAARIAIDSGFDAVEIHLGHGYFSQFIPEPADQPSRRRVRRVAGEPGEGGARKSSTQSSKRSANQIAVTAKLNMTDGCTRRHQGRRGSTRRPNGWRRTVDSTRSS